jgi:hypothetical protein
MGNVADSLYHSRNVHNEKSAKENSAGEKTKKSHAKPQRENKIGIAAKRHKSHKNWRITEGSKATTIRIRIVDR